MSIHLLECAARTPLPAAKKLALMAFADSADDRTGIGLPGLEQVKEWASLQSDSYAKQLVRELVDDGYMAKHRTGRKGRRAEYIVFPAGCCDAHRTTAYAKTEITSIGSATAHPDPLPEAATADPKSTSYAEPGLRVRSDSENTLIGSGKGAPQRTPSSTKELSPLTPQQAGGNNPSAQEPVLAMFGGCTKHPEPVPNCRGCGTTNRQLEAKAVKAKAAAARRHQAAEIEADRQRKAQATPSTAPQVAQLVDETRSNLRLISGSRP